MHNPVRIPIPAVGFDPPVYICPRRTKEFILDGNIDKPFWADVPFTDEFMDIEGPHMPAPRFPTRAKLQWDDEYLYIAALLKGTEIWAYQTERDSVIFRDNDFEIFIDPDSDTQQYYEFEMNALNTVWDLLLTKAYRDLGKPVNSVIDTLADYRIETTRHSFEISVTSADCSISVFSDGKTVIY